MSTNCGNEYLTREESGPGCHAFVEVKFSLPNTFNLDYFMGRQKYTRPLTHADTATESQADGSN